VYGRRLVRATRDINPLAAGILNSAHDLILPSDKHVDEERDTVGEALKKQAMGIAGVKSAYPKGSEAAQLAHDSITKLDKDFTPEQKARWKERKALAADLLSPNQTVQQQALAKLAELPPVEQQNLRKQIKLTPLQMDTKRLTAEDAIKVWEVATENERKEIRTIVLLKIGNSKTLTTAEKRKLLATIDPRYAPR
jgi:hypothetical protein